SARASFRSRVSGALFDRGRKTAAADRVGVESQRTHGRDASRAASREDGAEKQRAARAIRDRAWPPSRGKVDGRWQMAVRTPAANAPGLVARLRSWRGYAHRSCAVWQSGSVAAAVQGNDGQPRNRATAQPSNRVAPSAICHPSCRQITYKRTSASTLPAQAFRDMMARSLPVLNV